MNKTNIFVVGAAKAGTTWLNISFKEHPEIYVSPQGELDYFTWNYDKGPNYYKNLFPSKSRSKYLADVTPSYMVYKEAPKRIFDYNPDAKIIFILRDPVQRAISHYKMLFRGGLVNENVYDQIINKRFLSTKITIAEQGLYSTYLTNYLELFPQENIGIYWYDDLVKAPKEYLNSVFGFVGVEPNFEPSIINRKYHQTKGIPKNQIIYNLLVKSYSRIKKGVNSDVLTDSMIKLRKSSLVGLFHKLNTSKMEFPTMTASELMQLGKFYKNDILKVQSLTGRNLSHWMQRYG